MGPCMDPVCLEPKRAMKILIAGAPKSGTTGLFFKIKHSLPGDAVREMFEPVAYERRDGDEEQSVLAKALIGGPNEVDYRSFEGFDKKIGLVRDPRDWAISSLLYGIFNADFCEDEAVTSQILALLRRKEEDPGSVGVLDFIRLVRRLWSPTDEMQELEAEKTFSFLPLVEDIEAHYRGRVELMSNFFRRHSGYFILKYEDFVSGHLEDLQAYLGFPLEGRANVDPHYHRVVRTRKSGDWRNWFLKEDIAFFRPIFAGFMKEFGYADDWTPAEDRAISAEHASGYVRNLIAERRALTLMGDPAKANDLLETARKALRKVRRGFLPEGQTNGEELESEMVKLQVAVNFLAHQLAAVNRLSSDLETARGKVEAIKARLEESKSKLEQVKGEQERLKGSLSWRITRPFRSLARRLSRYRERLGAV
jgi:hypothetical protein